MDLNELKRAIDLNDGEETFEDVMAAADKGRYLIFQVDGTDITVVLTFAAYARKTRLRLLYAAGKGLDTGLEKMVDYFTRTAKAMGLDGIEFYGRKGWERVVKDYPNIKSRSFVYADFENPEED